MTTPSEQPDSQPSAMAIAFANAFASSHELPDDAHDRLIRGVDALLKTEHGAISRQRDALKAALEGITARLLFASWLESISGKARTEIKSIADDISALAQLSTTGKEGANTVVELFVVEGEEMRVEGPNSVLPVSCTEPKPTWSKALPNEQAIWWWWNEDEDSTPIPVSIMYSGTSDSYFASEGQWGWTRYQDVEEMGGWWMKCVEPPIPDRWTP